MPPNRIDNPVKFLFTLGMVGIPIELRAPLQRCEESFLKVSALQRKVLAGNGFKVILASRRLGVEGAANHALHVPRS